MSTPIAIVGRACLLPGASTPEQLGAMLEAGRVVVSSSPPGRFRLSPDHALTGDPRASTDRAWSDLGGYVDASFALDPAGLDLGAAGLDAHALAGLDPLFHWVLHCGRAAAAGAKIDRRRTGAIFGNLSFPTSRMAERAEATWLAGTPFAPPPVDPRNRFMSGLPAHLLARALGLGAEAFTLDAACASSLYAVALACEALAAGRADAMLAGAVCRADDLFIHVGFCALGAMSRVGQSRPFHAEADGLLPAEGAAMVLLKRLPDALRDGDRVLGVVRAVGLANDGRGRGLVAPSSDGQVRAMRAAYAASGLTPDDVAYVECHATGTPVGDATEIESLRAVFGGARALPIGSVKANMGHALAVAGAAGLLKLLHGLERGVFLPTPGDGPTIGALADGAFRVVRTVEPWVGPKRAALSAFGFGGNDAHLILEAPELSTAEIRPRPARAKVAVVALAARVGDGDSTPAFQRAILEGTPTGPRAERVEVPLEGLRTPPRDLDVALAQQTAFLAVAAEAARSVPVSGPRAMVVVGMGCDPEIARYGARWRLAEWAGAAAPTTRAQAQDAFAPALRAEGVLGTMPNIVANRVNAQLDAAGPSFSVSAEELSGLRALEIAAAALAGGDVDVALVGATDFSAEPVHAAALAELGVPARPADAAVALVLEREVDARRLGHPVLAWLDVTDTPADVPLVLGNAAGARSLSDRVGDAHAATGLVAVAAAVTALGTGVVPAAEVRVQGLFGPTVTVRLRAGDGVVEARPAPQRTLSLPAHPPNVALPEGLAVQRMEPAPKLVPVSSSSPSVTPRGPTTVEPTAPIAAIAVTPRPRPVSPGLAHVLGEMALLEQRIGAEHRAFLAQQAALHQQFLALRSRTTDALLHARPRLGAAAVGPAIVPPAPLRAREVPAPVVPAPASPAPTVGPAPASPAPVSPAPAASTPPVAASPAAPTASLTRRAPTGPTYDRAALEVHAAGRISDIFGPLFAQQDVHAVQVRMPTPPLLLADRVTGLEGPAGVLGRGVIWTETDVRADAFYMHAGRMTPGVMIESGQADLMLVSWQGIDFLNKGTRAYRLLGCNLTFHGAPPKAGETLAYEIHGDGHANQGDVRLFFFHYDCWIGDRRALSVREGQAGFFTKEELAASAGILWSPTTTKPEPGGRVDPPRKPTHRSFDQAQLRAFADRGDAHACFGPGFERAATHTRTPAVPGGKLLFLDRVTDFDPEGGPWKRGYLRATQTIRPDDWFFDGHFKNDPCMPGTLMFDGCLSTMAFYLAALGYTLDKDGYRFEPIPELEYKLKCRGQVTPASKELVYEVFVEEVHDGDEPRLFADLLCTVDGLGAFHAKRVGLRLVPDWPLTSKGLPKVDDRKVASIDGLPLDYRSLLACAWGQPSTAFGPRYGRFDGTRRVPRLPGPPYHYVTRVVSLEGEPFECKAGASVEVEYDVPPDAWYFDEGASDAMPFSVLLEAALQPCGWLASYVGSTLTVENDLLFRNLDGKGTIFDEVRRDAGVLRTRARIVNVSPASGMLIESFEVECFVGERLVFKTWSAFGFFPKEALENQVGLPTSEALRADFDRESTYFVDLRPEPSRYLRGGARLSAPMLRMIDRVTHFAADGGKAGLGAIRAEMDVDPHAWFFKAHFFQDPVQPGSLGVEAMRQTLAFAMLELGLDEGIERPRFLPLESKKPGEGVSETPELVWKYRGQVVPESRVVTVTMEIVERGRDARGAYARAAASLWVDGKRIYEARGLGVRIVEGEGDVEERLDLARDPWLRDHCPTFVVPALPMMSVVDRLAGAALAHGGALPLTLRDVQIHRWITVDPEARLRTEVTEEPDGSLAVALQLFRHARDPRLSRFEVAASGKVSFAGAAPAPLPALVEPRPTESPYVTGELFHGPSFQLLTARTLGENGAMAVLDAGAGAVPYGTLHQALLDAATHAIPHDRLHLLSDLVGEDKVAYPYRIASLVVHRKPPRTGAVRCEARFVGFDGDERFPTFDLALEADGERLVDLRLVEILMPKGPLGMAAPRARRAFLADRAFVAGLALSESSGGATILTDAAVATSDWLPGTLQRLYDLGPTDDRTRDIAVKEHVARTARVHPSRVALQPSPHAEGLPLRRFSVEAVRSGEGVTVQDRAPSHLDLTAVQRFWAERFGLVGWPVEDLCFGLARRFVADVRLEDPAAFRAVAGQSVLYLGNHQTGIESILFSVLVSALAGTTTMTLAKAEHRETWLGRMLRHWFSYPGAHDPGVIAHFDRKEAASLLTILEDLARAMRAEHKSLLVHVEGTRALGCRAPVATMSGTFVDLALALGAPVVPVRFSGGLPITPGSERLEFPVGMGQQTYHVGAPILPAELAALSYKARVDRIVGAINALGGPAAEEVPHAPDPTFASAVDAIVAEGVSPPYAVLRAVLAECPTPCAVTQKILARELEGLGPERAFATELSALLFPPR